jgi:ketosteroid isomerase-like protein
MSRLWLGGAVAVVAALVAAALTVALVTENDVDTFPEGSPEDALQRYLLALEDGDYEAAYGSLSEDVQARCSLQEFLRHAPQTEVRDSELVLEDSRTFDDTALVSASVTVYETGSPFETDEYSYERIFELAREDGAWRLSGGEWWCPDYPR